MKTFIPKPIKSERNWYLIDANDVILGRLAVTAANLLRGSKKVAFVKHIDQGDHVVVINAKNIALSGSKDDKKLYKHSGYPGGLSFDTYKDLMASNPEKMVTSAVKGMLPKNKLARNQILRLHVFAGSEHKYEAQKPKQIEINQVSQEF